MAFDSSPAPIYRPRSDFFVRTLHPGHLKEGAMKGINFGRVILGGIVAGILIKISEFLLNEKVLKSD
jgi:hypothetical protein